MASTLCRLPAATRACCRCYAATARGKKVKTPSLAEAPRPTLKKDPPLPLSAALRAAKDISMLRVVDVFRKRKSEFTPAHCLATLVMMDSEASERAHTPLDYTVNINAVRDLPETRELVIQAAVSAGEYEPHMFGNLLVMIHVFGMEEDDRLYSQLLGLAKEKLPCLTDDALETILEGFGEDATSYWSTLVKSHLPKRQPKPGKLTYPENNQDLLMERQPLLKLLDPELRKDMSHAQLAHLADTTHCFGAIDPNDLHVIVAIYGEAGIRNIAFLRKIRDFAVKSCLVLSTENLVKLYDEFEKIGLIDKAFIGHVTERMPMEPKVSGDYLMHRQHTRVMGILTKFDRPWTEPRFGKPYHAAEWDSHVDNRDNFYFLNRERQRFFYPQENLKRRKQGLPRVPFDGIMCPWLRKDMYGGCGTRKAGEKHKIFPGYGAE